jgi:hypothetical protein
MTKSGCVLSAFAKTAPVLGDEDVGSVTEAFGLSRVPMNGVFIVSAVVPA